MFTIHLSQKYCNLIKEILYSFDVVLAEDERLDLFEFKNRFHDDYKYVKNNILYFGQIDIDIIQMFHYQTFEPKYGITIGYSLPHGIVYMENMQLNNIHNILFSNQSNNLKDMLIYKPITNTKTIVYENFLKTEFKKYLIKRKIIRQ